MIDIDLYSYLKSLGYPPKRIGFILDCYYMDHEYDLEYLDYVVIKKYKEGLQPCQQKRKRKMIG